jgi:hypothetical protein
MPKGAQTIPLALNEAFMIHTGKVSAPQPDEKRQRRMSMEEVRKASDHLKRRVAAEKKNAPKKSNAPRRRMSVKRDESLVGAFPATYLFSLAANERSGIHVVNRALEQAVEIGTPKGTGSILVVSSEGIKVVDQMSSELKASHVLKEVTFTSVCGMRGDKVAYITEGGASGRILVHVLDCGADKAVQICEAFQKAFLKGRQDAMNPFKPPDSSREKPPLTLCERQISRTTLEAVKPVGAGQFGQVSPRSLNAVSGRGVRNIRTVI